VSNRERSKDLLNASQMQKELIKANSHNGNVTKYQNGKPYSLLLLEKTLERVVNWCWFTGIFIKYYDLRCRILRALKVFCCIIYCVPVIVTSQLKVVRLPVFDAAVNVNVA
jgi:hypothetical protein